MQPEQQQSAVPLIGVDGVPVDFDPSLPSPSATQIYAAGILPAIVLPERVPSTSPVRKRARSLFGSGQCSPVTGTTHSPLLAAFKDAHAEAVLLRTSSGSPGFISLVTSSNCGLPPLLELPGPIALPTQVSHDYRTPSKSDRPRTANHTNPFHATSSPRSSAAAARGLIVKLEANTTSADPVTPEIPPDITPTRAAEPGLQTNSPVPPTVVSPPPNPYRGSSGTRSPMDAADWEKRARMEYGLPPMVPNTSGFKHMSREERKLALAMLSRVNSKRKQAQSWPRTSLGLPANQLLHLFTRRAAAILTATELRSRRSR